MSLLVVCFSSYLASTDLPWRAEDYNANKFVHALKEEQINGYALIPTCGTQNRLTNANLGDAAVWFASMVRNYLRDAGVGLPLAVVPVPNSACTTASRTTPRTLRLADAVSSVIHGRTKTVDCLRWKKDLGSASRMGGPRDTDILYRNLHMKTGSLQLKSRVLLVDDVMTSGGHLRACARKIRESGSKVVLAVCGGRTTYEQNRAAFDTVQETLPD